MSGLHLIGRRGPLLAAFVLGVLVLVSVGERGPGSPAAELEDHNCRFWGIVTPTPQDSLIRDHLYAGTYDFARLGNLNPDGWGIAYFTPLLQAPGLGEPLIARAGTKANHPYDTRFPPAVERMIEFDPARAIVHLRKASTGAIEVPDPHPLIREDIVFAHNGTIDTTTLITLIEEGGSDYLLYHPPDYLNRYLDSELYMLYALRLRAEGVAQPSGPPSHALKDALAEAARRVYHADAIETAANVIALRGDTLFAMRFDPDDKRTYKLRYRACPGGWEVCSEPVGSDTSGWAVIPAKSVGLFRCGETPEFWSVLDPANRVEPPPDPVLGEGSALAPGSIRLDAHPNPFDGDTRVAFELARADDIDLAVFDAQGRRVRALASGLQGAGRHELLWDGRDDRGNACAAGVYFFQLQAGGAVHTRQVLTIR
ncbi:MAG: FlgD immunoglobulin-like domain containing protein [Candidatus Eisenbacteria bacterium]